MSLEAVEGLLPRLTRVREAEFNLYPTIPLSTLAALEILDQFLAPLEPCLSAHTSEVDAS